MRGGVTLLPPIMAGKKRISVKEKKFAKYYVENSGNATDAAIRAGYNVAKRNSAAVIGYNNLKKPKVILEIQKHLEMSGIDESYISNTLKTIIDEGKDRKVTANDALKALDMALKLKGAYPAAKSEIAKLDIRADLRGKSIEELEQELIELQKSREEASERYVQVESRRIDETESKKVKGTEKSE